MKTKKTSDHDGTRTRNLLIRSQTRYPLRYTAMLKNRSVENERNIKERMRATKKHARSPFYVVFRNFSTNYSVDLPFCVYLYYFILISIQTVHSLLSTQNNFFTRNITILRTNHGTMQLFLLQKL